MVATAAATRTRRARCSGSARVRSEAVRRRSLGRAGIAPDLQPRAACTAGTVTFTVSPNSSGPKF